MKVSSGQTAAALKKIIRVWHPASLASQDVSRGARLKPSALRSGVGRGRVDHGEQPPEQRAPTKKGQKQAIEILNPIAPHVK